MSCEIIVMGGSLGGFDAMSEVLAGLPKTVTAPLVIVLHRGHDPTGVLVSTLQTYTARPIEEIEDKALIRSQHVYLAPPNYHVLVEDGWFALSVDEIVEYARPSIDVLFESVAHTYRDLAVGIILSGGGRDGASGLAAIESCGGAVVVQDPATAKAPNMPQAAIAATRKPYVVPLTQIPNLLENLSL